MLPLLLKTVRRSLFQKDIPAQCLRALAPAPRCVVVEERWQLLNHEVDKTLSLNECIDGEMRIGLSGSRYIAHWCYSSGSCRISQVRYRKNLVVLGSIPYFHRSHYRIREHIDYYSVAQQSCRNRKESDSNGTLHTHTTT